jgi:hypothetical protein
MMDRTVKFLPPDHPKALAVKELLEPTRANPDYGNTIVIVAAHIIAMNALSEGVSDPAKACEWFKSAVETNMLANRKPEGSA